MSRPIFTSAPYLALSHHCANLSQLTAIETPLAGRTFYSGF